MLGGGLFLLNFLWFICLGFMHFPTSEFLEQPLEERFFQLLEGDVQILFLGFTGCNSSCPMAMNTLIDVYNNYREALTLKIYFIELNTISELDSVSQYAKSFHPEFQGITILPKEKKLILRQLQARFYDNAGGEDNHTSFVYLLHKKGLSSKLVKIYTESPLSVDQILSDLNTIAH